MSPEELAAYHRAYRLAHREELRARERAHDAACRDEIRLKARTYCAAHREEVRIKAKAWRAAHREEQKVYRTTHREEISIREKTWRAKNPGRTRASNMKKLYGLTTIKFTALLESQRGTCASCKAAEWGRRGPQIDHDHVTGKIRGILCRKCNTALGMIGDDLKIARLLVAYLEKFNGGE